MFEAINQAYARSTLPQEGIKKVTHNKQHEIYDNFKVLVEFQDIPHAVLRFSRFLSSVVCPLSPSIL